MTKLQEIIRSKSEYELMDYMNNSDKYSSEAIKEAVDELRKRGKNFTDEESIDIKSKIEKQVENENEEGAWNTKSWKRNIVTDLNAPLLYSKGAVGFFSLIFSPIFGAVLLSSNIQGKNKKWVVTGYGIAWTGIVIVFANIVPMKNQNLVLLFNLGGSLGLTTTFWDKCVGKEIKYRAKPIWKPLIISIIIIIPIILAMIYEN